LRVTYIDIGLDNEVDIADQTNKTAGQNATTGALAQIIAASIKAGSKSAATGLFATLLAFFGRWSEVFAGVVIVLVCIILIILFITGIYKPLEDIDKRIVDQIEEKKKKFNINKDDTLLSSLSQISLQFELLFEKIQNAYKSFLEKLEFFKTFSNELISDARNYSLYPIESERESNDGICDNIYTFDYNFIMNIENDIPEIYKGKGGANKVILLIKPTELQEHAKEIYGPEANDEVTYLNAKLDLDLDADKNYKYKLSCENPDNPANIFDATCKVNDIECTGDQPDVSNDYDGIN
jgi:Na+-transporting methylmalonyl-CoA/oxaloacetate decarboxylase gamma subunit